MVSKEIDSLDQIMGGAVKERFREELEKVWQNIYDMNTDADKVRKVILECQFKPNERRDAADMSVKVSSRLAPPVALTQTVLMQLHDDGSVSVMERSDEVPGQMDFEGNEFVPKIAQFNKPAENAN